MHSREHLVAIDAGLRASQEAALTPIANRYWAGLASIGPAVVLGRVIYLPSWDEREVEFGLLPRAMLFLCVVVAVVTMLSYSADPARRAVPLAPAYGGSTNRWSMAGSGAVSFGVIAAMQVASANNYVVVTAATLLWLAVVPPWCYRRFVLAMTERFL